MKDVSEGYQEESLFRVIFVGSICALYVNLYPLLRRQLKRHHVVSNVSLLD